MVTGEVKMNVGGGVTLPFDRLKKVMEREILIGIPMQKSMRKGDVINNASLLFIHTNGSPARGIPPRPVIEPALEYNKDRIAAQLRNMLRAAASGDEAKVKMYQQRVGLAGQNAARGWFTNPANHWAPNSPLTIALKGSSRPLIDTGNLRKSIIYVLR